MIARILRFLFGRRSQPVAKPPIVPIASHVPSCDCLLCTNLQIRSACEYAALHPQACGHLTRDVLTADGVTRIRIVVMQEPAFQKVFGDILGPVGPLGGKVGGSHDS